MSRCDGDPVDLEDVGARLQLVEWPQLHVADDVRADLGDEQAKAALKRLSCPVTIKDKRGQPVTDLCF